MSSVEFDGSHTPAKSGGKQVGYQGGKKSKTTNMLFLTDRQGLPLACRNPMSGEHHDLFDIKENVATILATLHQAGIPTDGLFLNGDAGHRGAILILKTCEIFGNIWGSFPTLLATEETKRMEY